MLYCLCQEPAAPDVAMVSCDTCQEWFHVKCVGLSRMQARSARTYHCPLCKPLRVRLQKMDIGYIQSAQCRQ